MEENFELNNSEDEFIFSMYGDKTNETMLETSDNQSSSDESLYRA